MSPGQDTARERREALDLLWAHVEQHWEEPSAHQALLSQCNNPSALSHVARLYRAAQAEPERRAVAERQLKAVSLLAFAQLQHGPRPAPGRPMKRFLGLWFVFCVLFAAMLFLALR